MVPGPVGHAQDSYGGYRSALVETVRGRGIRDLAVLRAIATVPRHLFVPPSVRHRAYEDSALPLSAGQTISQPSVQARSLEALRLTGKEKVLEIGAGSGYQTALLATLAYAVVAVERLPHLAAQARQALQEAGVRNVTVLVGDGTLGWRPLGPYDAIVVAAASPAIPGPLIEQLAEGGRIVIPLGDQETQRLTVGTKRGDRLETEVIEQVRFVPLLGEHGFPGDLPA